jgi:hypothetical protein
MCVTVLLFRNLYFCLLLRRWRERRYPRRASSGDFAPAGDHDLRFSRGPFSDPVYLRAQLQLDGDGQILNRRSAPGGPRLSDPCGCDFRVRLLCDRNRPTPDYDGFGGSRDALTSRGETFDGGGRLFAERRGCARTRVDNYDRFAPVCAI